MFSNKKNSYNCYKRYSIHFNVFLSYKLGLQVLQALQDSFSMSSHQINLCYRCYKCYSLDIMSSQHLYLCYKWALESSFLCLVIILTSVQCVTSVTVFISYVFLSNHLCYRYYKCYILPFLSTLIKSTSVTSVTSITAFISYVI